MTNKQAMLEMAARLLTTVSESKRQMLDEAVSMLCESAYAIERMTPCKVKSIKTSKFDVPIGNCPYCYTKVNGEMMHCDACGQALDWEDK